MSTLVDPRLDNVEETEQDESWKWWRSRPSPRPGSTPKLVPPAKVTPPAKREGYGTPVKQRPGTRHSGSSGNGQE